VDTTGWLIVATVGGPILGALLSPVTASAVLQLARVRAQRVRYVPVSGADVMRYGVPLTEPQFREAWAVMQAELDALPPPSDRSDWELQRCYKVINRFSMLTGTFPKAFPMLGDVDSGWAWYMKNNQYATEAPPETPRMLRALLVQLRSRPRREAGPANETIDAPEPGQ
jgi:hypothetical protein